MKAVFIILAIVHFSFSQGPDSLQSALFLQGIIDLEEDFTAPGMTKMVNFRSGTVEFLNSFSDYLEVFRLNYDMLTYDEKRALIRSTLYFKSDALAEALIEMTKDSSCIGVYAVSALSRFDYDIVGEELIKIIERDHGLLRYHASAALKEFNNRKDVKYFRGLSSADIQDTCYEYYDSPAPLYFAE